MSTRAIIAMPRGYRDIPSKDAPPEGFFAKILGMRPRPAFSGVYHHNGGSPHELGELIWTLVNDRYARDVTGFWREIIESNPAGWSSLFALQDDALRKAWDGRTKVVAAQHFASNDVDGPSAPVTYQGDPARDMGFKTPPVMERTDKMGADYLYVVGATELTVFQVEEDGVKIRELGRIPWETMPDWDALEGVAEEG